MADNNRSNDVLTASQVARLLKIDINTVIRWSEMGVLKTYNTDSNGDPMYKLEDIKGFLKNR